MSRAWAIHKHLPASKYLLKNYIGRGPVSQYFGAGVWLLVNKLEQLPSEFIVFCTLLLCLFKNSFLLVAWDHVSWFLLLICLICGSDWIFKSRDCPSPPSPDRCPLCPLSWPGCFKELWFLHVGREVKYPSIPTLYISQYLEVVCSWCWKWRVSISL